MARQYSRHKIDKRPFLISGTLPEMQNAMSSQNKERDNLEELTKGALGGVNRELYEYVSAALAMTFDNVISSQSVEFQKLAQQIYANIVEIIEAKMSDGEVAEALVENLDIYNGNVELDGQQDQQGQQTGTPSSSSQEESGQQETTQKQQTQIQTKTETNTEISKHDVVDKEKAESEVAKLSKEKDEQLEEAIRTGEENARLVDILVAKLRLAFVYLRSQKLDIFKILASADESSEDIDEKQLEMENEQDEEMRRRKNTRKAFHKSEKEKMRWFESIMAAIGSDEQDETPPHTINLSDVKRKRESEKRESVKGGTTNNEQKREESQSGNGNFAWRFFTALFENEKKRGKSGKEVKDEKQKEKVKESIKQKPRKSLMQKSLDEVSSPVRKMVGESAIDEKVERPKKEKIPERTETRKSASKKSISVNTTSKKYRSTRKVSEYGGKIKNVTKERPSGSSIRGGKTMARISTSRGTASSRRTSNRSRIRRNTSRKLIVEGTGRYSKIDKMGLIVIDGDTIKVDMSGTGETREIGKIGDRRGGRKSEQSDFSLKGSFWNFGAVGRALSDVSRFFGDSYNRVKSFFGFGERKDVEKTTSSLTPAERRELARRMRRGTSSSSFSETLSERLKRRISSTLEKYKTKSPTFFERVSESLKGFFKRSFGITDEEKEIVPSDAGYGSVARISRPDKIVMGGRYHKFSLFERMRRAVFKNWFTLPVWENILKPMWEKTKKKVKEKVKSGYEKVKEKIKGKYEKVKEKVKEKAKKVWEKIKGLKKEDVKKAWNKVKTSVKKKWKSISKSVQRAWKRTKKTAKKVWRETKRKAKKVWKSISKTTKRVWRSTKKTAKKLWKGFAKKYKKVSKTIVKGIGKLKTGARKVWKIVEKTAKKVGKQVKKVAKKAWKQTKKVAKKVWKTTRKVVKKVWKTTRKVAKKAWKVTKKVVKKVWKTTKKVAKKVVKKTTQVAKKVGRKAVSVMTDLAGKVWKPMTQMVGRAYTVATESVVKGLESGGKALTDVGKDILTSLPSVWKAAIAGAGETFGLSLLPAIGITVAGVIITGLGIAMTASAKFLKVAFKVIAKVSAAAARIIEKALKTISKISSKRGSSKMLAGKTSTQSLSDLNKTIGDFLTLPLRILSPIPLPSPSDLAPEKTWVQGVADVKAFITNLARKIRGFINSMIFSNFKKEVASGIASLKLKLIPPREEFHAKYGTPAVKKESEAIIMNTYNSALGFSMNSVRSGFSWIKIIFGTLGNGLAEILTSLAGRISIAATIGIKGLLKALFNWRTLLTVGIGLAIIYRDQFFPWLWEKIKWLSTHFMEVVDWAWNGIKTVWKWTTFILGGAWDFIMEQTDPNNENSITAILEKVIDFISDTGIIQTIIKDIMKIYPIPSANAYLIGMALGGFPEPLMYSYLFKLGYKAWKWLGRKFTSALLGTPLLGALSFWVDSGTIMNALGFSEETYIKPLSISDILDKFESATETLANQMKANGTMREVNAKMNRFGVVGFEKITENISKYTGEMKDEADIYGDMIRTMVPHLTSQEWISKVGEFTQGVFGDQKTSNALMSVFFYINPLNGDILSTIPLIRLSNVMGGLNYALVKAAHSGDPNQLIETNRWILTYFDRMNDIRTRMVNNMLTSITADLQKIANAKGTNQREYWIKRLKSRIDENYYVNTSNTVVANAIREEMRIHQKEGKQHISANTGLDMTDERVNAFIESNSNVAKELDLRTTDEQLGNFRDQVSTALDFYFPIDKGVTTTEKVRNSGFTFKAYNISEELKKSQQYGGKPILEGNKSNKLGGYEFKDLSGDSKLKKRRAWDRYAAETKHLMTLGHSDEEIRKMGYGKNYEEWSRDVWRGVEEKEKQEKAKKSVEKPPKVVLPKIYMPEHQVVSVSIPGLTREVKQGTKEYELYSIEESKKFTFRIKSFSKEYENKLKKRRAWDRYAAETKHLMTEGHSDEEIREMGYGKNYEEWEKSEWKDDPSLIKEPGKIASGDVVPLPSAVPQSISDIGEGKVEFSSFDLTMLEELERQQEEMARALDEMNKQILLFNSEDYEIDLDDFSKLDIKTEFGTVSPVHIDYGKLERDIEIPEIETDGSAERAVEKLEHIVPPIPKDDLIEELKITDAELERQGVVMADTVQQVSTDELYQLEQKRINEAKNVVELIDGISTVGENIGKERKDLEEKIQSINNNVKVVNAPPIVVPAPLTFAEPEPNHQFDFSF